MAKGPSYPFPRPKLEESLRAGDLSPAAPSSFPDCCKTVISTILSFSFCSLNCTSGDWAEKKKKGRKCCAFVCVLSRPCLQILGAKP